MRDYGVFSLMASGLLHLFLFAGFSWFLAARPQVLRKPEIVRDISQLKVLPESIAVKKEVSSPFIPDTSVPPPFIPDMTTALDFDYRQAFSLKSPMLLEETISDVVVSHDGSDAALRKMPGYMHYYQAIRAKLDRAARRLYDGRGEGIVIVSFVVSADGRLVSVTLEPDQAASEHLRDIAVKTIYGAVPFPSFPPELKNRTSLPFTININFKNN